MTYYANLRVGDSYLIRSSFTGASGPYGLINYLLVKTIEFKIDYSFVSIT